MFALMCAIGAKAQSDIYGTYHSDWIESVVKKNCRFKIKIALYPDLNFPYSLYVLYADTISESKINYTVYLYVFNDIETGEEDYITKTGTLEELVEWGKNPYAKDEYGNWLFATDKENYDIWNRESACGIKYKKDEKRRVFALQL